MSKTVIFVLGDREIAIEADEAVSVMHNAKVNNIPGIDADCGGMMACGTCHVIVLDALKQQLPAPDDFEAEILEYVPREHPDARLSCQLETADCPHGIRFQVPEDQR